MNFNVFLSNMNTKSEKDNFIKLLNEYIIDKMGGGEPYLENDRISNILEDIKKIPAINIFFALSGKKYIGMAVTFMGYSTFNAKPLINIHDIIVKKEYRNMGVAKKILEKIVEYGKDTGCCKITLEVRIDNEIANHLYKNSGFIQSDPPMKFLHKKL